MTEIKIDGKLTSEASEALGDHARSLYDRLGSTRLGIVELRAAERTTPAPGEDKKPGVRLRVAALEIAGVDQEDDLRNAQRALYLARTARGTLNEHGQIELSEDTVRLLGQSLAYEEAARLRAGLDRWTAEMTKVVNSSILTDGEIRHEVDRINQGLISVLHPARVTDSDDD